VSQLFEDLKKGRERISGRLIGEEMNMLRHENISGNMETLFSAGLLKEPFAYILGGACFKERLTTIATEGDEMEVSRLLITLEARWHSCAKSVPFPPFAQKTVRRMGHPHPNISGRPKIEGWGTRLDPEKTVSGISPAEQHPAVRLRVESAMNKSSNPLKSIALGLLLLVTVSLWFASIGYAQSTFNINLETIRRSVVYLHIRDNLGQLKEAGTGFLISVPTKSDPTRGYDLLVTARHIADPAWAGCPAQAGQLTAVFNRKDYNPAADATGTIEVSLVPRPGTSIWTFPSDDSVDIAVTVLDGNQFDKLGVENQGVRISDFPSKDELKQINSGAALRCFWGKAELPHF